MISPETARNTKSVGLATWVMNRWRNWIESPFTVVALGVDRVSKQADFPTPRAR